MSIRTTIPTAAFRFSNIYYSRKPPFRVFYKLPLLKGYCINEWKFMGTMSQLCFDGSRPQQTYFIGCKSNFDHQYTRFFGAIFAGSMPPSANASIGSVWTGR